MKTFYLNYPLIVSLLAIGVAQTVKVPIHFFSKQKWDWKQIFSTGGMPSSHSAAVSCLTTSIGLTKGFSSDLFAIASILGLIVMYDAMGIRRHAGETAMALNRLEADFDKHIEAQYRGKTQFDFKRRHKRLKEMLGHQPIEVIVGALTGILVAAVTFPIWH